MIRRGALVLVIIVAVALLMLFGAIYYAYDPSSSSAFPRCSFLSLTGYKCPGCGSQRAIHALMHGDFAGAFRYNALLLVSIPWVAYCLFAETQRVRNPRLYVRLNSHFVIWLFFIAVMLWWVLRNVFNW